ncbi:hypothetical protein F5880DRAFT_1616378 [Lentinula raphanica]|nr:hypothetical protein F5880DRAFT_1616378 [Lentinula raphanica]
MNLQPYTSQPTMNVQPYTSQPTMNVQPYTMNVQPQSSQPMMNIQPQSSQLTQPNCIVPSPQFSQPMMNIQPYNTSQPMQPNRTEPSQFSQPTTTNAQPIQSPPSPQLSQPASSLQSLQPLQSSHCDSQSNVFPLVSLDLSRPSPEDHSSASHLLPLSVSSPSHSSPQSVAQNSLSGDPSTCASIPVQEEKHGRGGRRIKRNTPAVTQVMRKSSRVRTGKRSNPDPGSQQDNAKKPKVKKPRWGYLVTRPDGSTVMADENHNIYGYVNTTADGDPYLVDENGCFLENVPKATFASMLT